MTMPASTEEIVEALRSALTENQRLRALNEELADEAGAAREPLAVVSMACRFPGGITDPDSLWYLVATGRDGIGDLPRDRGWDIEGLYDPNPDRPGKTYGRAGGFVDDVAGFDAEFFGISPREALAMDPQQRILLELAWEALERAGIEAGTLRGSRTGVFVGASDSGYLPDLTDVPPDAEGYAVTGNTLSVVSGRLSYVLGLEGPSFTVDTACSSSLVALHLGARALARGECTMALVGGATVMAQPAQFIEFSRQRALATDGRSKAFSAAADGFGPGEGVGLLVLERLSDARRHGHTVLAVLRGSAVNQDGASNGLTAPNGPSQQRVMSQALADAGLTPADVDVVEAHGTGTTLGDPIEAQALLATYGTAHTKDRPLWLGSVKSNIGHAQAAAGVAGVIKMVMALRHGTLPPTLHADEPTPHVDWEPGTVRLLDRARPWSGADGVRRAAVSSFGISGTNAHVILEEAPAEAPQDDTTAEPAPPLPSVLPYVVSGVGADGLSGQGERLAGHVAGLQAEGLPGLGGTLARRTPLSHRAVVIADGPEELAAGLGSLGDERTPRHVVRGTARAQGGRAARVAFVFPGQGTHWRGMARELLDTAPVFAAAVEECDTAVRALTGWSVVDLLRGDDESWQERIDQLQPVLFAVQVALARLWEAHGVRPAAVVGHSQGEVAAACVAGALTVEQGARVVVVRSRLFARALTGKGAVATVSLTAERVAERLAGLPGDLAVAGRNAPRQAMVSGDRAAVESLVAGCVEDGIRARVIPVSVASHSVQVEQIRDELLTALGDIRPAPATVPFYSTVTGDLLDPGELTAAYWYRNGREPVDFEAAVRSLLRDGHRVLVENSAHPVLTIGIEETAHAVGTEVTAVGTLRTGKGGLRQFFTSLASAWVAGTPVDWTTPYQGVSPAPAPTYAFRHDRYWLGTRARATDASALGVTATGHPLIAAAVEQADEQRVLLTGRLSLSTHPWLADHAAAGVVLLPGTGYIELALRAADEAGCACVEELTLQAPMVLPETGDVRVQVAVEPADDEGRRAFSVHSRTGDGGWLRHATGILGDTTEAPPADLGVWPPAGAEPLEVTDIYGELTSRGYGYGDTFRGLTALWKLGDDVLAEVRLPEAAREEATAFGVHPALLDAAMQAALVGGAAPEGLWLPFAWNGVRLHAAGATDLRVRISPSGVGAVRVDVADPTGRPVLHIDSSVARPVSAQQLRAHQNPAADALFEIDWTPDTTPTAASLGATWAVLGTDPLAAAETLTAGGARVRRHPDLAQLTAALDAGEPAPRGAVLTCAAPDADDVPAQARRLLLDVLGTLRGWLADDRLADTRLVVLTRGAIAVAADDGVTDLAAAPLWGLIRSAQAEHPGRFVLIDADPAEDRAPRPALARAIDADEPQLAWRGGETLMPRLARVGSDGALVPPPGRTDWRVESGGHGTLADLALVSRPEAHAPLRPGEVRLGVRAAGVNFRDVVVGLGMVADHEGIGGEAAGVVLETGPDVTDLAVGDRVMGVMPGAFSPVVVVDRRFLVRMPDDWTFEQAASVPAAFLTAYYGLVDLAGLREGETVLVHAATGGVGMAAVQLARHLGARVLVTASPQKWDVLPEMGFAESEIASSRSLEFEEKFLGETGGRGVDVVLDSLAGEFVDASLRLLPRGGRFIEMGKTDIRDAEQVATDHPGVTYRAFDGRDAGPDRLGATLAEIVGLFEAGVLSPLPVRVWDVRRAPEALRFMSQARHVGKLVLRMPGGWDRDGSVLVTGGTGVLGGLVARRLVVEHGVRHVILAGRRGDRAEGARELAEELTGLGAQVTVAACDVADRAALDELIAAIPQEFPLRGVVHAAGVLDDGLIGSLTQEQFERVLRPKVDAAVNLHEATRHLDLTAFVLFSAGAGVMGMPGQGNYAAANVFLDALAAHRRAQGLPAVSLAWGFWEQVSGMSAHIGGEGRARLGRDGVLPMPTELALDMFDVGSAVDRSLLLAARVDLARLRELADSGVLPSLWRGLVRASARPAAGTAADSGSLARRLADTPESERHRLLVGLVRDHTAAVLGRNSATDIDSEQPFKELGLDSLTAVELRNRLNAATGLRLPATLVFDHPTPAAIAGHLLTELAPAGGAPATSQVYEDLGRLDAALAELPADDELRHDIALRLSAMQHALTGQAAARDDSSDATTSDTVLTRLESATAAEVLDFIDNELGQNQDR
ncbi:SDR family NAD(P)-dependent oxidoreductase [Streptomyces sp. NPDC055214]